MNTKLYVVLGRNRLGTWTILQPPTPSRSEAEIVYNAWVETKGNGIYDQVLMLGGQPRWWVRPPTPWEVNRAKVGRRLEEDDKE